MASAASGDTRPARHTLDRMAREPDEGGAFVFDLVDDEVADVEAHPADAGAGDGPDGDRPDAGDLPASGGANRMLRATAPVAAVLAIALVTGAGFDGIRDGARMERMRDVDGGVADVSSPLTETWAWEGAVGPRETVDEGLGTRIAVLGDVLAFESDGELVGLDPATGAEAWTVPLAADPDCAPMGSAGWGGVAASILVCLAGSGADRAATVVGPDGVVGAPRPLDVADTRRYGEARPGPDGTVLRARRVGPAPEADLGDARCTDMGECTGTVDRGQDLELRAEDALTGEQRWRLTVPFRPTRADQCANWYGTSWDGSSTYVDLDDMLDPDAFGARVTDGLVELYGCGVESAVTPSGVVIGADIDSGAGSKGSLRTGGYAAYTFDGDAERTVLYGADGELVGEIDGYAIEPAAVDGSGPDTLLGIGHAGPRVQAYESDGTLRWDAEVERVAQMFLAQVAGTAVISTGTGAVRGLDLTTGEERWTWNALDAGAEQRDVLYVSRTFTDGQNVLLLTEDGRQGAGLVALDVASGEVAWEQSGDDAPFDNLGMVAGTALVAVDGNLLKVAPDRVSRLG